MTKKCDMFSIENLLSKNYSSKSSPQRGICKDLVDANPTRNTLDSCERTDAFATEVNGFAGKRETVFLGLTPTKNTASTMTKDGELSEDTDKERETRTDKRLSRKRRSKEENSCGDCDLERESESEEGMTTL